MSPTEPRKSQVQDKSKVARPDEMPAEIVQFINAIDAFKRHNMVAHLQPEQVLAVAHELGYNPAPEIREDEGAAYVAALDRYKRENKRLYPNWSEVFEVLREIGYTR